MESFVPQLPITDAVFTEEIWVQKNPVMGDHIRVKRMHGIYTHHGIYVSDNEVIALWIHRKTGLSVQI